MDTVSVSTNPDEKNKKNSKIKIIVISSIITLIIIIGAITAYFLVSSKYAKIAENAINNALLNYQQENPDFSYEPFSCSGLKTITCSSNSLTLNDLLMSYVIEKPVISVTPSVNQFNISAKGDILFSIKSLAGNSVGSINTNFNCNDNVSLISERSLMAHNVKCSSLMDKNIKSEQQSVIYMQDEAFAENSNMITLLLKSVENDYELLNRIMNSGFVIENAHNKVYSDNLLQDFTNMIADITEGKGDKYNADNIIALYNNLKNDYNNLKNMLSMSENHTQVIDSLISALDGIVYDNNNVFEIQVKYNNSEPIENMFNSSLFFGPEYYDINITSYK